MSKDCTHQLSVIEVALRVYPYSGPVPAPYTRVLRAALALYRAASKLTDKLG
jgi:hypothetical protein